MAAARIKRPSFISPKGTFQYPSLSQPDYGNESFPKPDGEFKVALVVPMSADTQAFIDKLMPAWVEAIALGQVAFAKLDVKLRKKFEKLTEQMFFEPEYDKESEQETGNVIFKFKTKYKITDKKTQEVRFNKIGLFDAKGKPLPVGTSIYGGTIGKVAFQTADYWVAGQGMAGISLRLSGAQVIELVGPGNRTAASMGFGEEDGYEAGEAGDDDTPPFDADAPKSQGANGNPSDF